MKSRPASTWETPVASPTTATGDALAALVPVPSSPYALEPQQTIPVDPLRAQVWLLPTVTSKTDDNPATSPAHGLEVFGDVERPSCPLPFDPQHHTFDPVVLAQLCKPPPSICDTLASWLAADVRTEVGEERAVVVPSPTWPESFHPQHHAALPLMAQVVRSGPPPIVLASRSWPLR